MTWSSFRRGLQTVHLWAGIALALPLIVIGISGSVLLVQREVAVASVPAAPATGDKQTLVRIIETARATQPDRRVARVQVPRAEGEAVAVRMQTRERPIRNNDVYVDPVSLQILETRDIVQRTDFARQLVNLHAFLLMQPSTGMPIVGWMGVAMTLMGISGLILWWPKKGFWGRAIWVRKGAKGLSLNLDLHHAVGFWSMIVFLIMSISGVYLVFPETFHASVSAVLPTGVAADGPVPETPALPGPFDADKAVLSAEAVVPNARARVVQMPDRPERPVVVEMENTGFGPSAPPILVTMDQNTGEVGYIDDPRQYAIGDKLLNAQHALHFGVGFGWIWKVLVFFSGVLPLFLAVTGVNIWWLKRRARQRVLTAVPVGAPAE